MKIISSIGTICSGGMERYMIDALKPRLQQVHELNDGSFNFAFMMMNFKICKENF
jgi:hypothetical protein